MEIAQMKKRLQTIAFGCLVCATLLPAQALAVSTGDAVDTTGDAPLPMPKSPRRAQPAESTDQSNASIAPSDATGNDVKKPKAASMNTPEKSSDHGFNTEDFMPQASTTSGSKKKIVAPVDDSEKTFVRVQLTVPRNTNAVQKFVAYPYPMQLPKARKEVFDLSTDTTALKEEILTSGYLQRGTFIKPYPFQGWRWQYAYHKALKRAHADEPAVITDIYPFVRKMMPYCREEVRSINNIEHERVERYKRMAEEYEQHAQEAETDATRKGYTPVTVEINKMWRGHFNIGEVRLAEGTWWITGTKHVPGLTYYWQQPVEVVNGQPVICELTEDNALVIEGGW
jgi:hypothetical protein